MNEDTVPLRELVWSIAEKLLAENYFATLNGTGEIYVYKEGVYIDGGEQYIERLVQGNTEKPTVTTHLVNEVIGHVQRSTFVKREEFDNETSLLVLENGLLDTETGTLEPHREDFYSLTKLPVTFDPEKDAPAFKRFLGEVLYPEDLALVQEMVGYTLHRGYPAQVAFLLVGEGSNGKSTLINVVKALLGIDNYSAVSLQDFEENRFAKADLFGKMANLFADLPDSALKSVGTFKMLTGGDPIRGEKKFQGSFNFVNVAKLIFSCNVVPDVHEDTPAFFRRWKILQFPHSFDDTRADKQLLKKLTTKDELSGVLNWALEGLARLKGNGWTFSNSRSTEETRLDYIRRSSPIKAFILDCLKRQATGTVSKKALFAAFVDYCDKKKLGAVTSTTFYRNLPMYFPGQGLQESKEEVDGKRTLCYRGMVLRPVEEWGKATPEEDQPEGMKEADA